MADIDDKRLESGDGAKYERHGETEEVEGRDRLRAAKAGHGQVIDDLRVFQQGLEIQLFDQRAIGTGVGMAQA